MRPTSVVAIWIAGLLTVGIVWGSPTGQRDVSLQGPVIQHAPHGIRIVVHLGFAPTSSALPPEALPVLDQVGRLLKDDLLHQYTIAIIGHANDSVYVDVNWLLAGLRALAVQQYLVQYHGIAATRLSVSSRGESSPHDPVNPQAAVNRYIEFVSQ